MLTQEQATTLDRKIERFSQILAKNPGDGLTVLALAEASFRRGLKLEALTAYQTVTKEQPIPEAHLAVAEIYSQQNMTSEAYGELRQLFRLNPENVEARLLIRNLEKCSPPPDDIQVILRTPASDEAFREARLRLQIQRAIHNRELQERTRNGTLEPGVVIHEYYVEEAKKKLIEVDEQLRKLEDLKAYNASLHDLPSPEPISAQAEEAEQSEVEFALDSELATAIQDFESQEQSAPELEELPPAPIPDESDFPLEEPVSPAEQEAVAEAVELPLPDLEPEQVSNPETLPVEPISEVATEEPAPPILELSSDTLEFEAPIQSLPTEESETPELVLLPNTEDVSIEHPGTTVGDSAELEFPPVPPPAEGLNAAEEVEELPPYPEPSLTIEPESVEREPQVLPVEQPSIDLSIPIDVSSALDPELPEIDEAEPLTLSTTPVVPMPEPKLNDAVSDQNSGAREGFGAPPAIEPISFGEPEEISPPPAAPIEVSAEPVADEPVAPTSESHSAELAVEPPPADPEPVVEPTPVPEPALVSEPTAVVEPPRPAGVSAAERQAYYESRAEEIGKLTGTLARTRGVSSIFLVARDGTTIDSVVKDDITEARVGELVKESFEFLTAYAASPAYWVLECAGGIFVMQTLDDEHVLIAIGQAGANFGALRYTMDKTKAKFEAILQNVPR